MRFVSHVARPHRNLTLCGRAASSAGLPGSAPPPHARTRSGGRAALILALAALALLWAAAPASASFGLHEAEVGFEEADGSGAVEAGSHPFAARTSFGVNTVTDPVLEFEVPEQDLRNLQVDFPPGFVADRAAAAQCSTAEFRPAGGGGPQCSPASAVGEVEVELSAPGDIQKSLVYNLTPPPGAVLKFGFEVLQVPVTVEAGISTTPPYHGVARLTNTLQVYGVYSSRFVLWGVPADHAHDAARGGEVKGAPLAFLTMPRSCPASLPVSFAATSWQGSAFAQALAAAGAPGEALALGFCDSLAFGPTISARPSTRSAQSPSGLDFGLDVEDPGLTSPEGRAAADIEKTVVTLPEGLSVDPSQAEGLEVCTEADLARESLDSEFGAGCPAGSKIGTIEVESPLLEGEVLPGTLFVAEPYHNKAGNSLIALYVVIKDPGLGIFVVQPLKVEPDPRTGQLVSTAEEMPQLPFSHFRLHFREGGRAPLISPPGCGTFAATALLYPSSGGHPVSSSSDFQITNGPGGGPCPSGGAPFHPGFEAGTLNNAAGSYSPFVMHLTRKDGEQDMGKFSFVLPPGVVPKLAGIPYCPDAAIARAAARQGAHGGTEELSDPSCPAASQIGRTVAGAGVGSELTYVPGKLYLAGPYHGDPISAVAITPAVAGPFDAGVVVVREALRLNPVTHVGEVDGAASDPIPHILKGIPLNLRDLHVYADKPEFTLNATSCEPFQALSTIWGDGTALEPRGETPAGLTSRYQAAGCASLGFKPKLGLKLRGGTKRGRFPALHAVYTPKPEDANLSRLALTFPKSEFIEQGHFRTICTRVQFAAGAGFGTECPKGSVYGRIKVWTPLLSEPLSGPVYLRSSNHNLPDAVFALHGLVDIELATRIDSTHGRLRAIVANSPDAPVSRAVVQMQGGQKGLFVNSRDLCFKPRRNRARVNAGGQNGKRSETKPVMRAVKCKKHRVKRHGRHHKKRAHRRSRR